MKMIKAIFPRSWLLPAVTAIYAPIVLFSGHSAAQSAQEDSVAVAGAKTINGIYDHGIEELLGYELVNLLPESIPFTEGEDLVFTIRYGLINAGEATLEIPNMAVLDSVECYHIVSVARTNKAFDRIFKVRDKHESFMDSELLISRRFVKHLREGKFKKDMTIDFDQKNHVAVYKDKQVPIVPNTRDFLTALYYIRTLAARPGQAVAMANHTDGRNYPIYVKFISRERVSVPAGEFDCIVVEPVMETSSIFENKGKLTIWLTDDNVRMPVMLRSQVIVGAFEAVLKEYTLGGRR